MVISERASERGFSVSEYCEAIILDCIEGGRDVAGDSRGDRILSEDDLDAIAGRIALELEALEIYARPERVGVENSDDFDEEHENAGRPPRPGGGRPCGGWSVGEVVGSLPGLTDRQASNLVQYIQTASDEIGISEKEVMVRMLAYTYEHQVPRRGGIFAGGLGHYDDESISEALENKRI